MRVDVHTHYLPPRYFERMDSLDARNQVESFSVYSPMLGKAAAAQFADGERAFVDNLIGQMDDQRVDLALLSIGAVQPYFPDEGTAKSAVHYANDMLAEAVELGGGRLAAFGSVPLPHTAAAVAEADRCLDELGFLGLNLGCSAADRPLDDPQFGELWAAADARSAVVFLHPGTTPTMGVGSGEFHLAPDFCSPAEMAVAVCRLIVSKVIPTHVNLSVISGAMGGSLPYLARRFDRGLAQSHPHLHEELGGVLHQLRQLWFDSSMIEDPYALDVARNSVGVDRLVFGSDVPRGPLADAVDFIAGSDRLDEGEKTDILDVRAARLLGLLDTA